MAILTAFLTILGLIIGFGWNLFALHGLGITLGTHFTGALAELGSKLLYTGSFFNFAMAFLPILVTLLAAGFMFLSTWLASKCNHTVATIGFVASAIFTFFSTFIFGMLWNMLTKMAWVAVIGFILGKLGWAAAANALCFGSIANIVVGIIWGVIGTFKKKDDKKNDD
jgi:hypothetical protein